MSSGADKFQSLINELRCLESELLAEADKKKCGEPSLGRGDQLEVMLNQVKTMQMQIEAKTLPPAGSRVRGMAAIVVDSWPLNSMLGKRLVAAEFAFLKLP